MDTRWKDHVLEWRVWQSYIKYQNQIKTISCSDKEITDVKEINTELVKFYKALFQPKINVSNALIQDHLNRIEIQNWLSNHKNLKGLLLHTNFWKLRKNDCKWRNDKGILRGTLGCPENSSFKCIDVGELCTSQNTSNYHINLKKKKKKTY